MAEKAPVLTPTESRQATSRRLNFRVLITSMTLAVVVAAILYYAVYGYPRSAIGIPEPPAAATGNQAESMHPPTNRVGAAVPTMKSAENTDDTKGSRTYYRGTGAQESLN